MAQVAAQKDFTARYGYDSLAQAYGPLELVIRSYYDEVSKKFVQITVTYAVPPAYLSMIWMLLLCVFYTLLCWYCNQVVAGRSGGGKRPWFFLTPNYWRPHSANLSTEEAKLAAQSRDMGGVVVHGATKRFGKFSALNGVSMSMQKGRCLALLGHNGAGKSTLINMLSGLLTPTSGAAFVLGHSLTANPQAIQQSLGTCPQDDIQYPQLTARQHLELYARFKGIAENELRAYVNERLEAVDLLSKASQCVGEYSGGMKRRLSLVCAGIGSPRFIILDEPTTGMDPHQPPQSVGAHCQSQARLHAAPDDALDGGG